MRNLEKTPWPKSSIAARAMDRRCGRRVTIPDHVIINVTMRHGLDGVSMGKLVNVSRHGALLDFRKSDCSKVKIDDRVSVKLPLQGDVIWLAGRVRHRSRRRVGIYFTSGHLPVFPYSSHALSQLLEAVPGHESSSLFLQSTRMLDNHCF